MMLRIPVFRVVLFVFFMGVFVGCSGPDDDCQDCGEDAGIDVGSDVGPSPDVDCEPVECADMGYQCGELDDGCGEVLDCGQCQAPATCGGGGVANICGTSDEPDPQPTDSEIDLSVPTDIYSSTSFLYEGEGAVQFGVEEGAVNSVRVAVVRGKVVDRSGEPVVGARVTAPRFPELGYTETREGGRFDMVFNAGGAVTLRLEHDGHLPMQRRVHAQWREHAGLTEIAMTQLDSSATTVDFNEPLTVAQGSSVDDESGSRSAAVMVRGGTRATIRDEAGDEVELDSVTIRATEYTSGADGPAAMPGILPPTSGYTYAVEYSVDEAMAAGANHIEFDQDLIHYTENFLDFPVGMAVPMGYFDEERDAWIPSENGRVIEVLSIDGALANLDLDGSGLAATQEELDEMGIDDDERERIAEMYEPGTSLWRVPIDHFTPWDCNWPYGPPEDAIEPDTLPDQQDVEEQQTTDCASLRDGSIIEVENQALGESIPLRGSPYSLNYRSSRAEGYAASNQIPLTLIAGDVPESLDEIVLEVTVAGRTYETVFDNPIPDMSYNFVWDGIDGFGRRLQGSHPAVIRLGYNYEPVYHEPADFDESFARFSGVPIEGGRGRDKITVWQESRVMLGAMKALDPNTTIGAWSLDVHHVYDPQSRVLYRGDGSKRRAYDAGLTIDTVAGRGLFGFDGDEGPADEARINLPSDIAIDAEGNYYLADTENHRVRKVDTNGVITTVAGMGSQGFAGEGAMATNARLSSPRGVAVDRDGRVYIADTGNHRVRMVDFDGRIYTVAGTTSSGFTGDDGRAILARLESPMGVAVDNDGVVYIADTGNHRVRMVTQNGIITTIAGTETAGNSGDGGLALEAQLRSPRDVDVDRRGYVFIADTGNHSIRRVAADGTIALVAGTGNPGVAEDGVFGEFANFHDPSGIHVDRSGAIFVADTNNQVIRRINSERLVTTVVGSGQAGFNGDSINAAIANLNGPEGVAVRSDGDVLVAVTGDNRIRQVTTLLPGFTGQVLTIPSVSGEELFIFDQVGRHLATQDALVGAMLYTFDYDEDGRLVTVVDRNGNELVIDRAADETVTGITTPGGYYSALTTDDDGYLLSVVDPMGFETTLTYGDGGLLEELVDPKGGVHSFEYDAVGRLIYDVGPDGRSTTLVRDDDLEDGYSVTATSALGRSTVHETHFIDEILHRLVTHPWGGVNETTVYADGETREVMADGMEISTQYSSDPRWGEQVRYASFEEMTTPGGLARTREVQRSAQLADPNDLFSLLTWSEEETINGRTETLHFDGATRTLTNTFADGTESSMVFDALAQMVEFSQPGQYTDFFEYDDRGLMATTRVGVGAQERVTEFEYDDQYKLVSLTNPLGQTLGFDYDTRGLPTVQTFPDGRTLEFSYDAEGELTDLVVPSGAVHELVWTEGNLLEAYKAPATATEPEAVETYHYSQDRELVRIEFADGRELERIYGDDGLVERIDYPGGSDTFAFEPESDSLSQAITADGESSTFTYDGPLVVGYELGGTVQGSLSFSYDDDFRLVGLDLDGTPIVNYVYDAGDRLTAVGPMNLSYEPVSGRLAEAALGGLTTSMGYNDFGEVSSVQTTHQSSTLYDLQMAHDALGRVETRAETVDGDQTTYDYTYGDDGRLTEVFEGGVLVRRYSYDVNGNRTLFEDLDSGESISSTYDSRDRLLERGDTSYEWSASGYLVSRDDGGDILELDYDVFGGLSGATLPDGTEIDYAMDYKGRRIGRLRDGVLEVSWIYDTEDRIVAELDGAGNVESIFVHGPEEILPELMIRGGETYRFIYDQVGSPRLIVNASTGAIAQRIDYDEFGQVTYDSNPGFQPFGFASGLYDRDTGLVRFGARDYDPETGRWTARDPMLFNGEQYNLYEYTFSDPLNHVDPEGLFAKAAASIYKNYKNAAKKKRNGGKKPKNTASEQFKEDVKEFTDAANTGRRLGQGDFAGVALDALTDFAKNTLGNAVAVKVGAFCGPLALVCGAVAKTAFDAGMDYLNGMAQDWLAGSGETQCL